MHNKRSLQLLYNNTRAHSSKGQVENHAQIHTRWPQNSVAESLVAVICNQRSNIPYISDTVISWTSAKFMKRNNKNNSFTDCHTEGLIMKASQLSLVFICQKIHKQFCYRISFVHTDATIKKGRQLHPFYDFGENRCKARPSFLIQPVRFAMVARHDTHSRAVCAFCTFYQLQILFCL